MNRCTAMMMTVLGAAILSSCATATVATRGTGQRFQDGLYASSDDSQTKEDRQESERINDILIEKTKASEIYLFSETSKDTVVIPQNMAATIKFNGDDGTSVTVAQAPDWLQEDAWRYDWMYGPYFYRPYGYWYGSYYGGWRYDPWYGYYDPWYGGYYSHWYAFHSPWYGCYDPWFGHHHHHHIFIEPMPDMGRKVVYASRNQTGTRGMSAGKLEGTVRTAVRSGANFTSSSTRTTPARERVVSKSRTDRTSTGDRLTPSSTSGYRRAGQTASSSSSASYRRPAASTDRSSSSTSGYSRSSSSSTSGYSRSSSSSTSGYSRGSSSSNSGYSRSSSSSTSGYSRSSSSSNSGYSRSSSSSSSSYSRGSSSSGYSGGASRGGGYSGGSRR